MTNRHTTLDPKQQEAATFWRVMNRDSAGKDKVILTGYRDEGHAQYAADTLNASGSGWYYPEEEVLGE